ncbi:permease [Flavobacterium magnum]|uniref:Permease n=1 Tax=Flavobacterium magnum TaxID=2162713 RepID=A0A2S0REW1_9FLAO|nr:Bax inhibitor-1 family protein [Flavobacterium magnum]AWA30303.1 permease [Flavobacterium magnum]
MEYQNTTLVAHASEVQKAEFYKKTYMHVALAILAFIGVETLLINTVPPQAIGDLLGTKFIWLFFIGLFWLGSMLSSKLAFAATRTQQYLGLGLYVLIEALIFLPMLIIAMYYTGSTAVITQAAIITLFMFGGLTAVVFFTKTDFSFLRSALIISGFIALGLIVAGALFGFELGLWFSVGMVIVASGSILYQTSQIKDHYATEQYVGAALQLFASVMLLFWYVLRILMSRK